MFSFFSEKIILFLNIKVILVQIILFEIDFLYIYGILILFYSLFLFVIGSRDYLQNLYDYLKGLVFVVVEIEAKFSGMIIFDS